MSDRRDHGGYSPGSPDDEQPYGFAAPHGADGSYVPEPLPTSLPPHTDQGTPFGAPPAADDWSSHTAAQDGAPYAATPMSPDDWSATPPATHPWQPQQPTGYEGGFDQAGQGAPGYDGYGSAGHQGHQGAGYDQAGQGFSGHAGGYDPAGQGASGYPGAGFADHGGTGLGASGHTAAGYEGAGYDQAGRTAPGRADAGFGAGGHVAPATGGTWHAYDYAAPQTQGVEHTAVLPTVAAAPEAPQAGGRDAGEVARPDGRTGSPIIPPGIQPAALTAVLGLLLAGGAAVGRPGLAVVLVLLQAVTAAGWFRLNGMWPARQGIALAFLAGVTADIAMLATEGKYAPEVVVGTLGIWLLLVLVLQLRHHGSADERLSSLTATSASTLVTILACGYLAAMVSDAGRAPVVTGAVAVAAATLVRALPLPGEPLSLGAALLVAAVTGALTGQANDLGTGKGLLLALACGACALIGLRVASYDFPSRFVHFTAGVALPLTAAAPVVYALGRALT